MYEASYIDFQQGLPGEIFFCKLLSRTYGLL